MILAYFSVCCLSVVCFGQQATQRYTDAGYTPAGSAPGAPSGSYPLTDFETVNLFSGNLNVSLPLRQIGGRGGSGYTMSLPINRVWRILDAYYPDTFGTNWQHHYHPTTGSPPESPGYGPGFMRSRRSSSVAGFCPGTIDNPVLSGQVLTRLSFTDADGTEIEFYDQQTGGSPAYFGRNGAYPCNDNPPERYRGNVWIASNGSGITFVSDGNYVDLAAPGGDPTGRPTGNLLFPDGTKYRIETGKVVYIVDINGNKTTFAYQQYSDKVSSITDSLLRVTEIAYGDITLDEPDIITFKGFGGATRTIEIGHNKLGNLLRSGYALTPTNQLFPGLGSDASSAVHNVIGLISYVKLPDGRQYNFKYNNYSDIARIELPTGGAFEYDWGGSALPGCAARVRRWVTERRVYPDGASSTYETKSTYEYNYQYPTNSTTVKEYGRLSGNDVLLSASKHYFNQEQVDCEGFNIWDTGSFGREYKTEVYAADGTTLLKKLETEFEFGQTINMTISQTGQATTRQSGYRSTRVTTTLTDVSPNLVAKTEFGYDPNVSFNRQTDIYEYDYGNVFKRRQHIGYLTTNPNQNNANYLGNDIHLKTLPLQKWASSDVNGNNKLSLTNYEYDNYSGTNRAALLQRTNVAGHDTTNYGTGNTRRGNLTAITSYSDVQNANTAITTYTHYDILGNYVETIDPKGNHSIIGYADNFGAPDGEARTNSPPTQLSGQSTFAFPTSGTNPLSWVSFTQVDYFTGDAVNIEDINSVITKNIYNDALDRPTQTVTAVGLANYERQMTVVYDDANLRVQVTTDSNSLNDNLVKAVSYHDGLGRTIESRKYQTDGNYITTKTTPFALVQDPETLVWLAGAKVSNPYRPHLSESIYWTTSLSDALDRTIKMIYSDNSILKTEFSGNTATITDQAGKKRRSVSDAFGMLKRIDEPNDAGQLDVGGVPAQSTSYNYDALNNLIAVTQGGQTRTFVYDGLSKLISSSNPESGSLSYQYDGNGNLISKTDARGIITTYDHDALNRVTTRNYNDSTPDVTYVYDDANVPNSKGKLTKIDNGFSKTEYTQFDAVGRLLKSRQTTDGVGFNEMEYTYDLSGTLTEEKYPSGRKIRNVFDSNGFLSMVQSKKNANFGYWTYADKFSYTSNGAVNGLRLGNFRWESTEFNSRLQPIKIAVGSRKSTTDILQLDFNYGTANNGNVQSQTITVPTEIRNNQTYNAFTAVQSYTYDSLNRLKDAVETISGQTWKQTYTYDRFGNRNFDEANTTTIPRNCNNNTQICPADRKVFNPSISASNNKIIEDQDNDTVEDYDFDPAGNTAKDATGKTFTYDAENKQTVVRNSLNQIIGQYWYDGNNKRVKKKGLNGAQWEETIFVYNAMGKMVAEYSTLVAAPQDAEVSYLTNDQFGSARLNTDAAGKVTARHDYQPFGEEMVRASYGSDDIRKQFTGKERDDESGLDYFEARYYSSTYARFTSTDPLLASAEKGDPQTWNRYSYVTNNPMQFIDPSGARRNPVTGKRGIDPVPQNGTAGRIRSNSGNPHVGEMGWTRKNNDLSPKPHHGLDINAKIGTKLVAAESGTVIFAGSIKGYGLTIKVRTANGTVYWYAHLSKIPGGIQKAVNQGKKVEVKEGEVIAESGNSGNAGGLTGTNEDHVHMRVFDANGVELNPIDWLNSPDAPVPVDTVGTTGTPPEAPLTVPADSADEQTIQGPNGTVTVRKQAQPNPDAKRHDHSQKPQPKRRKKKTGGEGD